MPRWPPIFGVLARRLHPAHIHVRGSPELDKLLPTADICITTPFWPAYLDKERLEKAKKLELSLTAGVGSDHIDLHAAAKKGITVAEVRHHESRVGLLPDIPQAHPQRQDFRLLRYEHCYVCGSCALPGGPSHPL